MNSRPELARAFALDTIAAAAAATQVAGVYVVSTGGFSAEFSHDVDRFDGVHVTDVGGAPAGLNPAVRFGIATVVRDRPTAAIAVLLGDLPALRPGELDLALEAARGHPLTFVRDADGEGTTLVTSRSGAMLRPSFGGGSAAAHLSLGHVEIGRALAGLRRDVDTADALVEAERIGISAWTRQVRSGEADVLS